MKNLKEIVINDFCKFLEDELGAEKITTQEELEDLVKDLVKEEKE